jgi:hypothetical protein
VCAVGIVFPAVRAAAALEEQRNGEWRYLEFLQVTSLIAADLGAGHQDQCAVVRQDAVAAPIRTPEQRLAVGGGAAWASAWWPGARGGLECSLDGVGDKLRGLRVDGDVAAEQHAADDLACVPGRILRVGGHVSPPS